MVMEHQRLEKRVPYQVGILLIAILFLVGCQTHWLETDTGESPVASVPSFTYSTSAGAIWQVDVNGHKIQLLPDDNVQKWNLSWSPGRRWLAYVAHESLQAGTREAISVTISITESVKATTPSETPMHNIEESLIIVDADGTNRRKRAGPARAIQYTWVDNCTIDLRLTHQLSDGGERQQWEQFWVDVETGAITSVEQEDWSTPVPIAPSPNGQWALSFETKGDRSRAYLLDTDRNRVATVYERPADQDVTSQWSPDSHYVLYLGYTFPGTDDIHVYDLMTGRTTKVTHFVGQKSYFMIWPPRWSPTGEWIFFVLDSETRTNQPCLVHVPEGSLRCFDIASKSDQFVWSVDGRYLAFLAPRGDELIDIYAVDAMRRKLLNLTQDGNAVIENWIAP